MNDMKRFEIEGFSKYSFGLDGSVYSLICNNFLSGCLTKKGYFQFSLKDDNNKQKSLQQHQIVYKLFNKDYILFKGNKMVIDHINSNKLDNHISNLRLISNRENLSKEQTIKSGLPVGVCVKSGKYRAEIKINGENIHLGYYLTPEEASDAYQNKLKQDEIL